jgi:2'-5' RNA ligase
MRAFVAVVPPWHVVEHLLDHLEPRRLGGDPGGHWRWTRPEQLHLTLAFLPELPARAEEPFVHEVQEWAGRHAPAQLRLTGAGAFPDPTSARVLWVGVDDASAPSADLGRWAHGIRALASRAGARVEGRSFHPHVTVARARGGRPAPASRLVQALDTYVSPAWTAEEVCLVASHLGQGPGGTPRYEVQHRWVLRA